MAFRGETIVLPVGLQGFNGSENPSQLQPGHLSQAEGVDVDGGSVIKDRGAQKLNSSALGSGAIIKAGINWDPGGTPNDVVFLDTGEVLKDTGAGTFGTTLVSGLIDTAVFAPFFAVGGGESVGEAPKLFMFSETNQVHVVDGTANSMAAISDPPADWASDFPIFGVQHSNRMFAGGNASDPHRIYYTMLTDHGDYDDASAGTLSVYPGEGRRLVGGLSFNGVLLLWKFPRGIYVVDTRNADKANWSVLPLTRAVGAASPQSIVQIGNDVLFLEPTGSFHLLSAVNQFGDVSTSDISKFANIGFFVRNNVALGDIKMAQGVWYPAKSKAWFALPKLGSIINDMRVIVDFGDPQQGARFYLSTRDTLASLWMRPDEDEVEKPVAGDDEGFVWLLDDELLNKDGAAYDMQFETAETDFSFAAPELASVNKNGAFLELTVDVTIATQLAIETIWDGESSGSIIFELGQSGAALGSFELGTDALASSGTETLRRKMEGSGRRLKLRVQNDGADEEVRISQIKAAFTLGDEATR